MAVLFISNNLLNPELRDNLRLPMEFICYAIADGMMYTSEFGKNTIHVQGLKEHGNSKVYGAIYVLNNDDYWLRNLDSYFLCSQSILGRNHNLDHSHRIHSMVTPISFASIDELERLMYREMEDIQVQMYIANLSHQKVKKRVEQKAHYNFRVIGGVNKNLIKQWRVSNDT